MLSFLIGSLAATAATTLDGHYMGTKSIMGYHITVDMKPAGEGFFALKVTGAPSGNVDCPKEAYTMDGSDLSMTNFNTAGDCAHDQFKAAKLKFKGATYDADADTITMKSKYLFISVTIVATKQSSDAMLPAVQAAPVLAAELPSKHYSGTKSIMGYHIKVDMKSAGEGFFALSVTGSPGGNVNCPKEAYTLDGTTLDMPNFNTAGDCAHDQFKAAKLKFKGATYDAASDTITLKSKYLFIGVTIHCSAATGEIEGESIAPLERILNKMHA